MIVIIIIIIVVVVVVVAIITHILSVCVFSEYCGSNINGAIVTAPAEAETPTESEAAFLEPVQVCREP